MFNLKKIKNKVKIAFSTPSYEQMLSDQNKERDYTLNDSTPNLNGLLDSSRSGNDTGQIHEANLQDIRDRSYDSKDQIIESQLDERDSYVVHRSDKAEHIYIKPMDALSEAYDQKYRKAYISSEEKGDTDFWDKFVGDQMLGEKTKVSGNVPSSGSQLQNDPERFEDLNGVPFNTSAVDNFSSFQKSNKIKPMIMASKLKDADAMLFGLHYNASINNREINPKEQMLIDAISAEKITILSQIDPTKPSNMFNTNPPLVEPDQSDQVTNGDDMGLSQIDEAFDGGTQNIGGIGDQLPKVINDPQSRDVDFLDGNPSVESPVPGSLPPDIDDRYEDYQSSISRETPMIDEEHEKI